MPEAIRQTDVAQCFRSFDTFAKCNDQRSEHNPNWAGIQKP